jgi:transcriptional regulator with XRE-family HTH domain
MRKAANDVPARRVKASGAKRRSPFGERLAELRRQRGLTQAELAEKAGVDQPTLSDYEQGRRRLHGQAIVDLCRALGTTADVLLGMKDEKGNGLAIKRPFLRRLRHIDGLSERQQRALLQTLDAFLAQARLKARESRDSAR